MGRDYPDWKKSHNCRFWGGTTTVSNISALETLLDRDRDSLSRREVSLERSPESTSNSRLVGIPGARESRYYTVEAFALCAVRGQSLMQPQGWISIMKMEAAKWIPGRPLTGAWSDKPAVQNCPFDAPRRNLVRMQFVSFLLQLKFPCSNYSVQSSWFIERAAFNSRPFPDCLLWIRTIQSVMPCMWETDWIQKKQTRTG